MNYQTLQDQPLTINFNELLNDRSWVLSGELAIHYPCNENTKLSLIGYEIEPNVNYSVSFKIQAMNTSPVLGLGFDSPLHTYTTAQNVTVVLNTSESGKQLNFWGTGYIELKIINIQKEVEEETDESENTITWSEKSNRWVSFRSYRPEKGFSMFTDMFTYKNGILFQHKEGSVRNNFYDKQYQTLIDFPTGRDIVKTYQSVAIHANQLMVTTEDGITTQLGQVSDLIEVDFNSREGIHYANFLRDKLTDLVNGDRLKGRYIAMRITTVDGSQKLQLFKVIIKSAISTANE